MVKKGVHVHPRSEDPSRYLILLLVLPFIISTAFVVSASNGNDNVRQTTFQVTIGATTDPNTNQPHPLDVDLLPGGTASFPLEVTNQGTQSDSYNITAYWTSMPSSWAHQIDLNAPQGSGIELMGDTIQIDSLGPGQSHQFTVVVEAPYESDGWQVSASFEVISGNDPLNATDSCDISVDCDISPGVTLEVLDSENIQINGPLYLRPGEDGYLFIHVTNIGNLNDTFTLHASEMEVPPLGWDVSFSNQQTDTSVRLSHQSFGGHEAMIPLFISIPEDAKEEEGTGISIIAESDTDTNTDTEEIVYIDIISSTPVILLESDIVEKTIEPAAIAEFEVRATNLADRELRYTPPSSLALLDGWVGDVSPSDEVTLDSKESTLFYVSIEAASSVFASESITFEVMGSSDEGVRIIPIGLSVKVEQVFEITTEIAPPNQSVLPGGILDYMLTVSNAGNGVDYIKVVSNLTVANWDVLMSNAFMTLAPMSQSNTTIQITVPEGEELDTYTLAFDVIRIMEPHVETLEQVEVKVTVIDYPDLTPVDLEISDLEPNIGDTVTITATISNLGLIDAQDIKVKFLKEAGGGSQFLIGEVNVNVTALGEQQVSVKWEINDRTDRSIKMILVEVDPENEVVELEEDNNDLTYHGVLVYPRDDDTSSENGGSSYWGLGTGGGLVVITFLTTSLIIISIFGLNSEAGRFAFLKFMVVPLYSKLSRDNALTNETREQIYDYVQTHPGDHFRSIMSNLHLTNGTVAHHLTTLEKLEYIKSERDGSLRRFYPKGQNFTESIIEINGLQGRIMEIIADNPGISQKELASVLEISAPTLNYHIKALRGARLIRLKRAGKRSMCYVYRET